jgi:alkylated DNA repair protein alkB family protein 6
MDFAALYRSEKAKAAAIKAARANSVPIDNTARPVPSSDVPEKLEDLGHGISYCGSFLSHTEARALVEAIDRVPSTEWASLTKRRLLNLGGVPHPSGSWAEPLPQEITGLVSQRLIQMGLFSCEKPANQVLLNEYSDGSGIDSHNDGPLFEPVACIVSLGGDAVLNFYALGNDREKNKERAKKINMSSADPKTSSSINTPVCSVILRANSLVVFSGEAYESFTHGIDQGDVDIVGDSKSCLNLSLAAAKPDDVITRPPRRLSLTLRRLARVTREFEGEGEYVPLDVEAERQRRRSWWLSSISEK